MRFYCCIGLYLSPRIATLLIRYKYTGNEPFWYRNPLLFLFFRKYRLTNSIWRASLKCTHIQKDEKTLLWPSSVCNSSSCLLFLGSPSTVLVSTSPPGFLIRRGHLISWLRFLIRSGLCDSPDPDAESSSCQDSGSSFPILSSKCQLATAAPVTRSSILFLGAGASVVGPIALTDVPSTPVPKLYSSY